MDEFYKPIRYVDPSGLTVITERTEKKGIIAGEIRVGVGAAHAFLMSPRWVGLPHFKEHMNGYGETRSYRADEIDDRAKDHLFYNPNALTGLTGICHFAAGPGRGRVLPTRYFWAALEMTAEGVFFQKYDQPTIERERQRILNEIAEYRTQDSRDEKECLRKMFGAEYLGHSILGDAAQVSGYTRDDLAAFDRTTTLGNTTFTLVGDITHEEGVARVLQILKDVPPGREPLPALPTPRVQRGEFQWKLFGADENQLKILVKFPAPTIAAPDYYATQLAIPELSRIMAKKIIDKYGLYMSDLAYLNPETATPEISLLIGVSDKEKASSVLAYAFDVMQDPTTERYIAGRPAHAVEQQVVDTEVLQPRIENRASQLNDIQALKGPLLSYAETLERYRNVRPEQMADVVRDLNRSPIFLNVKGHTNALSSAPTLAYAESCRSMAGTRHAPAEEISPPPRSEISPPRHGAGLAQAAQAITQSHATPT